MAKNIQQLPCKRKTSSKSYTSGPTDRITTRKKIKCVAPLNAECVLKRLRPPLPMEKLPYYRFVAGKRLQHVKHEVNIRCLKIWWKIFNKICTPIKWCVLRVKIFEKIVPLMFLHLQVFATIAIWREKSRNSSH